MSLAAPRVAVVGAGLGGLAATLGLASAGVNVALFEQAQTLEAVRTGWGMLIWPNGVRALQRLGVADEAAALGHEMERVDFCDDSARVLRSWPIGAIGRRVGAPAVGVSRSELHEVLSEAVAPGSLRLGARCVGFEEDEDGVTVRFADGREERADALVAADGLRSLVRGQLGTARDGFPPYAGYSIWHAVISRGSRDPVEDQTFTLFFGRGSRFAHFNVDDERLYWSGIAYTQQGAPDPEGDPRDVALERFSGYGENVHGMIDATPAEAVHRGEIFGGEPLREWGSRRVTMLGDAAHPMTTVLGQGACMALEDGAVIGEAFAGRSSPEALRVYEGRRIGRTTDVMALAQKLNSNFSSEGAVRCWIRKQAIRHLFGRGVGTRYEAAISAPV